MAGGGGSITGEDERNFKALRLRCSLAENSLELSTEGQQQQQQQHPFQAKSSRVESGRKQISISDAALGRHSPPNSCCDYYCLGILNFYGRKQINSQTHILKTNKYREIAPCPAPCLVRLSNQHIPWHIRRQNPLIISTHCVISLLGTSFMSCRLLLINNSFSQRISAYLRIKIEPNARQKLRYEKDM